MFENLVLSHIVPEDEFEKDVFLSIKSQFIDIISKNNLTISETRYLFNKILEHLDRNMPVTNQIKVTE